MMTVGGIQVGSLVWALAGREKDSLYVAVRVGGGFVYLADGRHRKAESPKKKSMKHISPANAPVYTGELTNKKLRRLINQYMTHTDEQQTRPLSGEVF